MAGAVVSFKALKDVLDAVNGPRVLKQAAHGALVISFRVPTKALQEDVIIVT
jgi:hypothetical protein